MTRRSPTALSPLVALCAALAVVLTHAAVALAQPAPQAPTPVRSRRDRLNPPAVVVAPGAATPAPGARPLPTAAAAPAAPAPTPARPTGPAQVVAPVPGITSVAGAAGTGANIHEFDAGMEYQALPPGAHDLETLTLWLALARESGAAFDAGQEEYITTHDHDTAWRFTVPRVALEASALRAAGVQQS